MSFSQLPEIKMEMDSMPMTGPFHTPPFLSPLLSDSRSSDIQRPLTLHCKLLENQDPSIPREDCYKELSRYLLRDLPGHHMIPPLPPPVDPSMNSPDWWRRVALDTLIGHLHVLIPDMTRIFNNEISHKESLLLTLLEFAQLFFTDPVALVRTLLLRNSAAKNLIVTFRILLSVASLSVKEQGVKVLLRMLETFGRSGKIEDDSVPTLGDLMLNADLDDCLVKCLHLNQKPLFNDVIHVLLVLMTTSRNFPAERAKHVMEESLRVTHLTILDDGLNRDTYFKFLWTAYRTLERQRSLPLSFEFRVMALFHTLLDERMDFEGPIFGHFGEFARRTQHPDLTFRIRELYNKFMSLGNLDILLKLLQVPVLRHPLAQHMIGSESFLKSLEDGIENRDRNVSLRWTMEAYDITRVLVTAVDCPGYPLTLQKQRIFWKLSRLCFMLNAPLPIISHAWVPMVKFFIAILKSNFRNRLVKIVEVECKGVMDTVTLRNPLNQIQVAVQNLGLRMKLSQEDDELVWEFLLEHHKYTIRRYEEETATEFDPPSPPFYMDHLFRKSTQYFLRSYLARVPGREVPLSCLEFLQDFVIHWDRQFILDGRSDGVKRIRWKSILSLLRAIGDWLKRGPDLDFTDLTPTEQARNAFTLRISFKISHFGDDE